MRMTNIKFVRSLADKILPTPLGHLFVAPASRTHLVATRSFNVSLRRNDREHNLVESKRGWSSYSTVKKLSILWSGAFASICIVAYVNYIIYAKNLDEEQRSKKLERAKEQKSPLLYVATMPCMRNTILLSLVSAFGAWAITFLMTSNPAKAYRALGITPFVVGSTFFVYCHYVMSSDKQDAEKLNNVLKDLNKSKFYPKTNDPGPKDV